MSDMPYNLVGVSLQTKYTTKERTEVRSFAISETIMSYLPVTAPLIFIVMCLKYVRIVTAKLFVVMKWRITLWGYN